MLMMNNVIGLLTIGSAILIFCMVYLINKDE